MHCFSCLELLAGNSVVCVQVAAKPWHAALFLLENVPREDLEYRRSIQEAQILFSKALWFTSSLLFERSKVLQSYIDSR